MAKVEIAICTFNRARHLDQCLSVLSKQTAPHQDWSVLVVDNASTDETADVVKRHIVLNKLPGLRCVFEKRPGLTSARQCAAKNTSAEFIAFVDDDCHLYPDWIGELTKAIGKYPDAAAFGGQVQIDWAKSTPKRLRRHGWIFAEQPHGFQDKEGEVGSLVGAGISLNRARLIATGWVDKPMIEDRIGRGATSGGDVEIGLRLKQSGGRLIYSPKMKLKHMISEDRQTLKKMIELSEGLGAGAALLSALQEGIANQGFLLHQINRSRSNKRYLLKDFLLARYSLTELRLYRAFENGKISAYQNYSSTGLPLSQQNS